MGRLRLAIVASVVLLICYVLLVHSPERLKPFITALAPGSSTNVSAQVALTNVTAPTRLEHAPASSCYCSGCMTPKSFCSMPEVKWKHLREVPWSNAFPQPPARAPTGCILPKLDPWDPKIMKLVTDKPWERVSCSGQKTLLYTSQDQLILNTSVLQELNLTRDEVVCSYRW